MKRLAAALVVLVLLLSLPAISRAKEEVVTFAFDRNFPPYSYIVKREPVGFEVDILMAALERRGYKIKLKPMKDWDRVQAELASSMVQVVSGMTRTELREKLFIFPDTPTLSVGARFFVTDRTQAANRFDLRAKPISVRKAGLHHRILQSLGGYVILPFDSEADALKALWLGQADAYFGPDKTAMYHIRLNDWDKIVPLGAAVKTTTVHFALYKGETELRDILERGLREMMASGRYDEIYRKWFVQEMEPDEIKALADAASKARVQAYAPRAGRGEGAAVLTLSGQVYTGASVENAVPERGLSALQVAMAKAVNTGDVGIRAVSLVDMDGNPRMPGPGERQLIAEFGREVLVVVRPLPGGLDTWMISKLLPYPGND